MQESQCPLIMKVILEQHMNKWTRRRIIDAFSELVFEYGYEDVTVTMIMDKAEVGKTTFYRYFQNKADVLNARCKDMYDSAINDKDCLNLEDLFTRLFRFSREHPEELSMYDTIGYYSYRDFMYKYTYNTGKRIMESAWGRPLTVKEDFHVAFFCAGGSKMLEEWTCGKYRTMTPEEAGHESASMMHTQYDVDLQNTKIKKGVK